MAAPAEQREPDGIIPFELVIFDCDGVLVDSEIIAADVLSRLLSRHGREAGPSLVFERFLGQSFRAVQEDFAAATGRPLPEAFQGLFRLELEAAFRDRLQPVAGIREVLAVLQASGRPFALASSSSLPRIGQSLDVTGLAPWFEGRIFASSMVARGKPAPDLFLHVAGIMGADPARTLVVEDSIAGVQAGKAAGMTVWGFTGGGHHQHFAGVEGLLQAGADRIVTAMAEFFGPDGSR